jgi:hypothetical protein
MPVEIHEGQCPLWVKSRRVRCIPGVYLNCRRSPLFLSVCDTSAHQKLTKKIAAFGNLCWFTGKLEPVLTKHTTLIQHIFLACDAENGENFQADSGTERFADAMAR